MYFSLSVAKALLHLVSARVSARGTEIDKQVAQEWFPPGQAEEPS
jgi:hypothetical protein